MSKRGYKDHFGHAASAAERSNRQNRTEQEDQSLEAQIKRANIYAKEEAEKARIIKATETAKKEEVRFAPGFKPEDEKYFTK